MKVRIEEQQQKRNGRFNIIFAWNALDTGIDSKEVVVEGLTYFQIERLADSLKSFKKNYMSTVEVGLGND